MTSILRGREMLLCWKVIAAHVQGILNKKTLNIFSVYTVWCFVHNI